MNVNQTASNPFRFDSQNESAEEDSALQESLLNAVLRQNYNPDAQMSPIQIEAVSAAIRSRGPNCNMLVFGLGNDSPLWANLNHDGYTLFLENIPQWIAKVKSQHPDLNVDHVDYSTNVAASMKDPARLVRSAVLPENIKSRRWDVILVDGPMGWRPENPGRAMPLVWTALAAHDDTHVFVDDYERDLEKRYADFLFAGRAKNRSVVLPRPVTSKLNASDMLWLFGISKSLSGQD